MVSNVNRLPDGVPGGFSIYLGSSTAIVAYATAEVIILMPRCKAKGLARRRSRGWQGAKLLGSAHAYTVAHRAGSRSLSLSQASPQILI